MEKVFIGVDGGGTGLRLSVEDEYGRTLFEASGGPANIRTSPEAAWHSIMTGLQQGFKKEGLLFPKEGTQYSASFGLAGVEHHSSLKSFLNYPHPFDTLIVSSDAQIACLGAHGNNPGAIIIVGTGIIGYQQEGELNARVGGWGFPHDDEGSGAELGLKAVRATFEAFDGRAPHSLLTQEMQTKWRSTDELLAYFHHASSKTFASVVPLVFEAASNHDKTALLLIKNTCEAIYKIGNTLFQNQIQSEEPLPLVLLGGLAAPLMPYLNESFKRRLTIPLMSPEKGALLLIK